MTNPTPHTVEVSPLPVDHPVGGHSLACTCGLRWGTSFSRNLANREAFDHLEWHTRSGK